MTFGLLDKSAADALAIPALNKSEAELSKFREVVSFLPIFIKLIRIFINCFLAQGFIFI
ncbi:hypothetical protein [Labrenzia sp. THAF82]|uniref:hypothetical protein n=1 Tax=Labrenzia sp. THAF82 TaxID=2587861 RepID=UPI001566651F|nr:hypothetical protein [Labrenzia sp. THAF82]